MTGWMSRLKDGLSRTRVNIVGLFSGGVIDDALFDELEIALIGADVGVAATAELLTALRTRIKLEGLKTPGEVREALKDEIARQLAPCESRLDLDRVKPLVMMVAGVNGAGKTTSIGKLAHWLADRHKTVLLAAGDTFRAAAVLQLTQWAERCGVDIIKHGQDADPGAVAYDACEAALARKADVLLLDTAGRLHTQDNLMRELSKIQKVVEKKMPGAPHEVLLVLDATIGQNAVNQARSFSEHVRVTGIILAKLDGSAKGGIVIGIRDQLNVPVKLVGLGEQIDDIEPFDPETFVEALFSE